MWQDKYVYPFDWSEAMNDKSAHGFKQDVKYFTWRMKMEPWHWKEKK